MKLHQLFEKTSIEIKDPKAAHALKQAGINYKGRAADDMSAFIMQTQDDQTTQDTELTDLDRYNGTQDTDIDHNDDVNIDQSAMLNQIMARLDRLEADDNRGMDVPAPTNTPDGRPS